MERVESRKGLKPWWILMLLLLTLFSLQSCAAKQPLGKGADLVILYHGTICRENVMNPLVVWFEERADLDKADGNFIRALDDIAFATLASFDFSENGLLFISPGTRGAGNCDIRLSSPVLDIADDTALIQLTFIKASGIGAIDSPSCTPSVLIKLPKGDFHHIQAWDEKGLFMVKIRIPQT